MKTRYIIGIVIGFLIVLLSIIFLYENKWFKFILAIGLIIGSIQFFIDIISNNLKQREKEEKFLEFSRALASTVKSGIPISKAILQISKANYGALDPHIKKLANQITWGIPLSSCLNTFASDTRNRVVKKSISIVIEAEKSGGNITDVLDSITNSVLQIKKLKDERRSNAYSQLIQGYFIFFIFIAIMLVIKIYLIPQLGDVAGVTLTGISSGVGALAEEQGFTSQINIENIFLAMVLIQGLFAGLMIGKFSEGDILKGIKHSLILMASGYLIITLTLSII